MQKKILLVLIILLLPLKAGADVITLRSGQILEGMITSVTDERIIINFKGGPLGINYTAIKQVANSAGSTAQNSPYIEEVNARIAVLQEKKKKWSAKLQAEQERLQAKKAMLQETEIFRSVAPIDVSLKPSQPKAVVRQKKVEIYTTNWCPVCRSMRSFLNSLGIKYRDYDIEKNPEARKRYGNFGAPGVPVLVVDRKFIMAGFNAERVKAAVLP